MFLIIFGLFTASVYSYLILPNNEGSDPKINPTLYPILYKGMVIIPYNKAKALHLHHWVFYILIYIASFFVHIPPILIGFSLGLFIQGIKYKDSCTFICNNPYN